ncbi:hypothetical protein ABR847_006920 [Enterobacter hormaechei]|uniref:hypothetical protein n=1 Tax=Enterobacter cloacae complex TaxID=354276 RepID=UPI001F2FF8DC|nr:hypothetical protein [Enterobacter hormaechei]MCF2325422.1 hypothetical protein [Enterobacter hormaechei]MCF2359007.1 hypothetical protein [Enterobacter hormaechei]MCF2387706.1 hypothetical protein [Enterobacter hormaechei]MDV5729410.1 hypothetical protein [Enterobacter hormaechei]MDV5752388.1 hypothetical protein [Enterobacter hormaechei]
MQKDLFAGSWVSVFYNSDISNVDMNSQDFVEIPETGAFPQTGIEREVITVPNFTHKYSRKLIGRGSVPDIDLTVNYIPGSIHDQLFQLAEDGKRGQFKIVYWMDATREVGVATVYNGFLSTANRNGGESEQVSQTMTLSVDGGPIASGIIDKTSSGTDTE